MWFRNMFDSLKPGSSRTPNRQARSGAARRRPAACRLAVETLEDRLVPASLAVSDVSLLEGNAGTTNAVVIVRLSAPSQQPVMVNYSTADGTASAGSDYQAVSGKLTFAKGETSKSILVPVIGDTTPEPDEAFFVNLSGAKNATIADGQGVVTIQDDDPRSLSINDVSGPEGNSGTTPFTFTVSLSAACAAPVTVNFATQDGTALGGEDYQATSGTLTFAPGETSKPITVEVIGDTTPEPGETFFVTLSGATNALIADGQGIASIVDDEPRLSINDVSGLEGNSGTTPFTFTVSLSAACAAPVTVNFATQDGTALGGQDYQATSGTLTFAPGETSKPITVEVIGDTTPEPGETFFINLSGATNALIADGQGIASIMDDEPGIVNWDGGGGDFNWNNPLNWATDRLPGPADDAVIGPGAFYDITINHASGVTSVRSLDSYAKLNLSGGSFTLNAAGISSRLWRGLTVSGGELTGAGVLTLDGFYQPFESEPMFTWSGGTLRGGGTTVVNSALNITGAADKFFTQHTLVVNPRNGIWTWSGTGRIGVGGGGTIANRGRFEPQANTRTFDAFGGAMSTFVNAADFVKWSGTGTTTFDYMTFTNNSGLSVQSGSTLNLAGGLTNFSATTSTLTGGIYYVAGTLQFAGANLVTNAADLRLDGPAPRIVNELGSDALAAFARNDLGLSIYGGSFATAQAFTNNGWLDILPGATLNFAAGLTNFSPATSTLTGGYYGVRGTLQFSGANLVTNAASIRLDGPGSRIVNELGANALAAFARNDGDFSVIGRSFATAGAFTNSGVVTTNGTLTVNGDYTQTAGRMFIEWPGALTVNGNYSQTSGSDLYLGIGGRVTVNGDYTQSAGSTLSIAVAWNGIGYGLLQVTGTARLDGALQIEAAGAQPPASLTYQVMTFGSRSGTFADVSFSFAGWATVGFGYWYDAGGLTVTAWISDPPDPGLDPP